MAERQSWVARRSWAWLPGLILAGLALQAAIGVGAQLRRELRLQRPPAATLAEERAQAELDRFASFVAERVPEGEAVLYVTPGASFDEMWAYYRLSYELYPSAVWWVTPVPRSPVDPWLSAPLDGPALAALAREKGARYVVADGAWPLERLAGSAAEERPGRAVLRLDEGQEP